jgi:hypothetical protein
MALAVALAVALHLIVLGAWPSGPGSGRAKPPAAAPAGILWLRVDAALEMPTVAAPKPVERAPAAIAEAAAESAAARDITPAREAANAPAPLATATGDAAGGVGAAPSPAPSPSPSPSPPPTPTLATATAAEPSLTSPAPAGGGLGAFTGAAAPASTPPTYATRLPPAGAFAYELRQGGLVGRSELHWQPEAEGRWTARLHSEAFGRPLVQWDSRGGLDAAGLAPERFVEGRRGRDLRAANFQRAAGRITFSGPPVVHPLVPGAQDRLSWLVQLAGIVEAAPEAFAAPGAGIEVFVVGARGEGEVWRFTVQGRAPLDLPAGRVEAALHLVREAERPWDTRAEVWLDPARSHWPVRVRWSVAATDDTWEIQLAGPA